MIGIFGGTFDPVHYGHLRSALEVKDIFGLDEVRLIPCADPPHRGQPAVTAEMRLRMLELAIQDRLGLTVDTRELDRHKTDQTPSYMVDTLQSLRQEFPNEPLLLFIGTDAFEHLTGWHQWQRLFDYAHIAVMTRPGFETPALNDFFKARLAKNIDRLRQQNAGQLYFQQITQLDISATAIRDMIARKQNPVFLLPDAVIEYIKQNKLYETH
ncbi:nicotinate-nucleotide adenylyltransferase [Candidatus Methylobacter oryzae]|uniref:Probable nicotinate-nucleotide adenylyltransferase n=1 Tax=Candidatus Methylobacter oryzae TaxID=2497749 RepID=A0ABY3CBF5_9GAMM|nr:nicotinate-nucleotide adenylyltransferase [Candidatus Methylobacter oryzae]TRW96151.1 nicotinate-nucleotide adenylyltransferase [Candidatus Methylobacter oryzae]